MKRTDFYFIIVLLAIFLPFFLSTPLYEAYKAFNADHGMFMSFLKFGILSTLGEMLGARISRGEYLPKGFGMVPKMLVWGILGMFINGAMTVFSSGIPTLMQNLGMPDTLATFQGPLSWGKFAIALSISVAMNTFFAPVFMTFHKITDMHIHNHGGRLSALVTPIPMGKLMAELDWKKQWGFVFKKTIPLFWYPAHTITFLLPGELRVLFAALLGIVLGVLLAVAAKK